MWYEKSDDGMLGSEIGMEWEGSKIMVTVVVVIFCFFFFFKQKTAYEIVSRDWSSDVCSSDLTLEANLKTSVFRFVLNV